MYSRIFSVNGLGQELSLSRFDPHCYMFLVVLVQGGLAHK
jgi:hypothetical protein